MRPVEGIDRIKLTLNPFFINADARIRHIDPYNLLRLDKYGIHYTFQIQAEYFNPLLDYQIQIAFALNELVKKGILMIPDTWITPYFIYKYIHFFVINITALEFYSDFRAKNLVINEFMSSADYEVAKEENILYQYSKDGMPTDTYYSSDGNKQKTSSMIIYNKNEKDLKDNHIKKQDILNNPNGIRFEWKLCLNNTSWLHWDNLKGNYKAIFNRYKECLAVVFNNNISGCITVHGKENKNFNKVKVLAVKTGKVRYTGGKLKKVDEGIQNKINMNTDKDITELFNEFSVKKSNIKKAAEMTELYQNQIRNGEKRTGNKQ